MMTPMGINEEFVRELLESLKDLKIDFDIGSSVLSIAAYIFMAIGLYTIASRRRIDHPWLAWIPVASLWLLGCISDQYHYVTKGEERSRRKRMLTLNIVEISVCVLMVILMVVCIIKAGISIADGTGMAGMVGAIVLGLLALLLTLPLLVVSIWLMVETFCSYYDLFSSCNPNNKTVFTVVSIVAACLGFPILAAIFVFACRNKEEGMPPRIEE